MGFRFRKSIPIGKHFRINLSKSGIGYSCGVKGARFTKTTGGKNRTTLSIPGTGISYTTESKAHAKRKPPKKKSFSRRPVSKEPQSTQASQQQPDTSSNGSKDNFHIASWKTAHPIWFWILAISLWPISLSIWFLKTGHMKKLNQSARICLLVVIWCAFLAAFGIAGIAGIQEEPKEIQLSDPISKITSIASPYPTIAPTPTPEPEPTPTPTPEPASTPAPEKAKPSASPSQPQQNAQNSTAAPGTTSGAGGQTAPPPANEANYVLNTSTHKFHRPTCSEIKKIHTENRQDVSGNRNDIISQGYTPCKKCNP